MFIIFDRGRGSQARKHVRVPRRNYRYSRREGYSSDCTLERRQRSLAQLGEPRQPLVSRSRGIRDPQARTLTLTSTYTWPFNNAGSKLYSEYFMEKFENR